jgi:phytanoyl-CoA hydroxylase
MAAENGEIVYDKPLPDYEDKSFVSAPAMKGSAVLIDGLVVHKSAPNKSKYARPIYTFHLYDADSCDWDPKSWLQKGQGNPFPPLFTE